MVVCFYCRRCQGRRVSSRLMLPMMNVSVIIITTMHSRCVPVATWRGGVCFLAVYVCCSLVASNLPLPRTRYKMWLSQRSHGICRLATPTCGMRRRNESCCDFCGRPTLRRFRQNMPQHATCRLRPNSQWDSTACPSCTQSNLHIV